MKDIILQISPYFFQRAANGPRLPDRRPLTLTASQAKATSASTVSSKHPQSKSAFQQIALRYGPKNLSLALFQSLNQKGLLLLSSGQLIVAETYTVQTKVN